MKAADPVKLVPRKRVRARRAEFPRKNVKQEVIKLEEENSPEIEQVAAKVATAEARAPPNWELFLEKIREMRRIREAPVDSMGCERVGANGGPLPPKTVRFQHLVALMLSAQTKDEVTAGAVTRLREQLPDGLTPETVVAATETNLEKLIFPVGFYRRKAIFLRQASQMLLENHGGDVPQTIEEITKLPGVGPKMGYLLLQAAWGQVDGIGVDVHVHRLAQLWGWVPKAKNPTPERTRAELEKWLPKSLWAEINPLLVGFGQTWCPSRSSAKLCAQCHLLDLCPAAKR